MTKPLASEYDGPLPTGLRFKGPTYMASASVCVPIGFFFAFSPFVHDAELNDGFMAEEHLEVGIDWLLSGRPDQIVPR